MMLSHVTGVGSLSNQLCSILDILIWSEEVDVDNDWIVLESTPSKSPILCHLLLTGDSNLSNLNFSGFDAIKYEMISL